MRKRFKSRLLPCKLKKFKFKLDPAQYVLDVFSRFNFCTPTGRIGPLCGAPIPKLTYVEENWSNETLKAGSRTTPHMQLQLKYKIKQFRVAHTSESEADCY